MRGILYNFFIIVTLETVNKCRRIGYGRSVLTTHNGLSHIFIGNYHPLAFGPVNNFATRERPFLGCFCGNEQTSAGQGARGKK